MSEPTRDVARWARGLLLVLCPLFGMRTGDAQTGPTPEFSVNLEAGLIRLGATTNLVITVRNHDQATIEPLLAIQGVRFGRLRGPEVRTYSTFDSRTLTRNFERTMTWTMEVRPHELGDYVIGPVVASLGGERVESESFALTVVEDLVGEELGLFRITSSKNRVVEGEPFLLEVELGWDAQLSGRINHANLMLPWWERLDGVVFHELPPSSLAARASTIPLNTRDEVAAEYLGVGAVDGREYVRYHLRRRVTPGRVGTLELSGSFLEFARVVTRGSIISPRSEKAESYYVGAPELAIEVVPLPEEGRPIDYSGAIGSLSVGASAEPREVQAGDSIKLAVEWSGEGNLEYFRAPDLALLDAFADFRVYGTTEQRSMGRRQVIYDLAAISPSVSEIPAVRLSVFDSDTLAYTYVESAPIPIRVRALDGAAPLAGVELEERFAEDIEDILSEPLSAAGGASWAPPRMLLLAVPALLLLGWAALRRRVRARQGDPDAPLERRRRLARRSFARALSEARDAAARLAAAEGFLAALSKEVDAAWVGRDPRQWWGTRSSGAQPESVERWAGLLARLESAVYGGASDAPEQAELLSAADELWRTVS